MVRITYVLDLGMLSWVWRVCNVVRTTYVLDLGMLSWVWRVRNVVCMYPHMCWIWARVEEFPSFENPLLPTPSTLVPRRTRPWGTGDRARAARPGHGAQGIEHVQPSQAMGHRG